MRRCCAAACARGLTRAFVYSLDLYAHIAICCTNSSLDHLWPEQARSDAVLSHSAIRSLAQVCSRCMPQLRYRTQTVELGNPGHITCAQKRAHL